MKLEDKINTALKSLDINLYDIEITKENNKNIFRVYITKDSGVNIDDCYEATKLISPILDIDEPIKEEYTLEVSSPGIERKLKKLKHFQASIGENVKAKLNSLEVIKGKLLKVEDDNITIKDESEEIFNIKFDDILSASTYFKYS